MANELLNIVSRVNNAIRSVRIQRIAINTVFAIHKDRIFNKGLDDTDSRIGTYSTRPIKINASKQARDTGKTYFKGGYAEYKTAIGKNPGYVNLRNTDQMQADYGVIQNGSEFGIGFQNEYNSNKAGWNTDKYNKNIFSHTNKEVQLLADTLVFELNKSI